MNPCPHFLDSFPQLGNCAAHRPACLGKDSGKAKLCPAPPSKTAPGVSILHLTLHLAYLPIAVQWIFMPSNKPW